MPKIIPPEYFSCPQCMAKYRVTYRKTRVSNFGSAYCLKCHVKMIEWNDGKQPTFWPVSGVEEKGEGNHV